MDSFRIGSLIFAVALIGCVADVADPTAEEIAEANLELEETELEEEVADATELGDLVQAPEIGEEEVATGAEVGVQASYPTSGSCTDYNYGPYAGAMGYRVGYRPNCYVWLTCPADNGRPCGVRTYASGGSVSQPGSPVGTTVGVHTCRAGATYASGALRSSNTGTTRVGYSCSAPHETGGYISAGYSAAAYCDLQTGANAGGYIYCSAGLIF